MDADTLPEPSRFTDTSTAVSPVLRLTVVFLATIMHHDIAFVVDFMYSHYVFFHLGSF